jgi:AAA+ ATPase superfamily predicted ATPase
LKTYFRCLDKLLLEYKRNTRGGSCLLYGRRYSGKSLLLEEILDRHFSDEDGIVKQQIDGNKYTSSTPTSKIFSDHGLSALVEIEREHGEDKEKATVCT